MNVDLRGAFWTPSATILGSASKMYDRVLRSIFANGEQGFAYEPNDLTDAKIKWRRNLFTETEFRNGVADAQIKGGVYSAAAFAGLTTGTGIQLDRDAVNGTYVYKNFAHAVGVPYVFSAYVRMTDGSAPIIGEQANDAAADVCIVAKGAVVYNPYRSITSLGGGLYRVVGVITSTAPQTSFGFVKYALNSARPVIVSGFQIEVGSAVSQYQSLTDFNSEFLAAFPQHALYQDALGVIPATAAGQPIGLVLDKRVGQRLGAELVTVFNSTLYSTLSGSTLPVVITSTTNGGAFGGGTPSILQAKTYMIEVSWSGNTTLAPITLQCGNQPIALGSTASGSFKRVVALNAYLGGSVFISRGNPQVGQTLTVHTLSVKEVLGNHAHQAVSASRPVLRQTPILGNELATNGNFSNGLEGWGASNAAIITNVNNSLRVTSTDVANAQARQAGTVAAGKTVECSVNFKSKTGTSSYARLALYSAATGNVGVADSLISVVSGTLTFTAQVPSNFAGNLILQLGGATSGDSVDFDDVTIKEITSYRTDQNYFAFDGVDDFLTVAKDNLKFLHDGTGSSIFVGYRPLSSTYHTLLSSGLLGNATNIGYTLSQDDRSGSGVILNLISNGSGTLVVNNLGTTGVTTKPRVVTTKNKVGTHIIRLNALQLVNSPTEAAVPSAALSSQDLRIGNSTAGFPLTGHVYSLIAVSRLTTDVETSVMERELAKQTGAPLNV